MKYFFLPNTIYSYGFNRMNSEPRHNNYYVYFIDLPVFFDINSIKIINNKLLLLLYEII